jgi:hypothetical protein
MAPALQRSPTKLHSISQDSPESKSGGTQFAAAQQDHSPLESAVCDVELASARRLAPEPWLEETVVDARRAAMIGSNGPQSNFIDGCEWIGLGSFCAVSRALQALNMKRYTYPFDWTRSPMDGVIHCFDNNFQDFCTHSSCTDHGASGKCFEGSQWGGSFWHHDPTDAKTQQDFARRIRRLYGQQEVPATKPRVFVRSVNSTSEISSVVRLEEALRRVLPQASVYLLILIDNQPSPGPMRLIGHENILFYKTGEEMFANNGATWSMLKQAEAYCEAIGFAAHFWAGSSTKVVEEGDLQQILASVTSFEGGDCNSEMFWPQRTQPCVIRGRDTGNSLTASAAGASIKVSSQSFAQRLSQSVPPPRVEPRKGVAISPALSHRHLNISNPGGFRSEMPLQFCH